MNNVMKETPVEPGALLYLSLCHLMTSLEPGLVIIVQCPTKHGRQGGGVHVKE